VSRHCDQRIGYFTAASIFLHFPVEFSNKRVRAWLDQDLSQKNGGQVAHNRSDANVWLLALQRTWPALAVWRLLAFHSLANLGNLP
jgi:hypothetical protein